MMELETETGESVRIEEGLPLDADVLLRYISSCGGIAHYEDVNGYFRAQWSIKSEYKRRIGDATAKLMEENLIREPEFLDEDERNLPQATFILTSLGEQYLQHSMYSATHINQSGDEP